MPEAFPAVTVPPGCTRVTAFLWGGGGGGGRSGCGRALDGGGGGATTLRRSTGELLAAAGGGGGGVGPNSGASGAYSEVSFRVSDGEMLALEVGALGMTFVAAGGTGGTGLFAGPVEGGGLGAGDFVVPGNPPATVTLKYHLNAGPVRPYVGAGPSLFMIFGEKPGAAARTLGAAKMHMSEELGFALQAGVDVPVNSSGMGISLDAKKYFIDSTLHVKTAAGTEVLTTKHKLDPWVVSGGIYFRF